MIIASDVDEHLDGVRVVEVRGVLDTAHQVHAGDVVARPERRDGRGEHLGPDHRLVALDEDPEVRVLGRRDLGHPVRGALVTVARHHDAGAERLGGHADLVVAGRDHDLVDVGAEGGPEEDVLDHRPTEQRSQRLPGEPARAHAGRDDRDRAHEDSWSAPAA
jgi:hypothetical protein